MSSDFDGFPRAGLQFLEELGRRNKPWFDANRKTYDEYAVGPTKAFVTAIGECLADGMAPNIVAQPKANGSISPINNDLRFSPDKSPYKDHLLLAKLGKGREFDIAGSGYKKVPKPYAEDHPRADLLRQKGFQARWPEAQPKSIGTAEFADWSVDRLSACADVHRWLVSNF
jgi:uncharacterized protein (DUF2461 family)